MVLSIAGYGNPMPWEDETDTPSSGHTLTFRQTLRMMSDSRVFRQLIPPVLRPYFKAGREVELSDKELRIYLDELIEERRREGKGRRGDEELGVERHDLLSNMVKSADAGENEKARLSPSELVG